MPRAAGCGRSRARDRVTRPADHRPYFEVMFRPELYRVDDPGVRSAPRRAAGALPESADGDPEALARSMLRLVLGAVAGGAGGP